MKAILTTVALALTSGVFLAAAPAVAQPQPEAPPAGRSAPAPQPSPAPEPAHAAPSAPAPQPTPTAPSAPTPASDAWGPRWSALAGSWSGAGQGQPGQGGGSFTFAFDLDRKILVRRSTSDYPAANGRPATHHEDLMVVHSPEPDHAAHAVYFDNEGHVIEYQATWSADGKVLTFQSAAHAGAPTFRLTYAAGDGDVWTVTFAMAAPGSDTFRTYVSGEVRRTPGP
jgi:hypothetical protein